MASKPVYFKLGPKSSIFFDSKTGLKVTANNPASVDSLKARTSKKIAEAKANNHIIEITEDEFKKLSASVESNDSDEDNLPIEEKLSKMNKAELMEYYKENFEVDDNLIADFNKLNKDERVKFLVDLESEEDEDEE